MEPMKGRGGRCQLGKKGFMHTFRAAYAIRRYVKVQKIMLEAIMITSKYDEQTNAVAHAPAGPHHESSRAPSRRQGYYCSAGVANDSSQGFILPHHWGGYESTRTALGGLFQLAKFVLGKKKVSHGTHGSGLVAQICEGDKRKLWE
jgi:hypothetical protein